MSPLAAAPTAPATDLAWHRADLTGCPAASPLAAAFTEDSTVKPLTAAGPIEAVLRESGDGSRMVLCLNNPSPNEARINLNAMLPEHAGAQWHFVSGAVSTSAGNGGLYAHLAPSHRAWLTVTP